MKLRSERDTLVEALGTAGRAVTSRGGALPVLSGVRLEVRGGQLLVTGSDLDLTIQVEIPVGQGTDGVCVIPAKLAADIVRALEAGAVSFEAGDDDVRITAGRSQFAVRMLPAGDFPRLPFGGGEPAVGEAVTLAGALFADALRQVVRAASADDARPILTGVLMAAEPGGLRLVATDSYRLAVRDLPGTTVLGEGQQVLVPSKALSELQRLLSADQEVTLRLGDHDATFEVGHVRLTTRLIEGEFPNYRQLIPSSYPNRLVVGREALLDAVRRVKLLVRDATTPVRLALRSDVIVLTVVSTEVGQASEEVDAKYEGAEMTVAFNPAYLIDGVEAVAGDEIVLETLDALRPAVIRPVEGEDYTYLLMPVRVS
ncbi:MAG TPA: DNA polymerase III subunit beta [Acidimicrobiales bacterium]|nr:DNA polymerase III subunit beta [Acidimicrobiales bacterium]